MADDEARTPLEGERLFFESGASWLWVLAGPASAAAMLAIQLSSGNGVQWVVPVAFLVLVSGFVALQVKAARIHTSVELTRTHLRQGTQIIDVADIVKVYPEPKNSGRRHYNGGILARNPGGNALANRAMRQAGIDPAELEEAARQEPETPDPDTDPKIVEKWQAARALGELTGVPRGRTGIGLRLTGDRLRQAWARNHRGLREALTPLVQERAE